MRPDRELAIEAMRNLGWEATRTKPGKNVIWEFRRDDTGGVYDLIRRRQDQLSMGFVADTALRYGDAPDLANQITDAKEAWLKERFRGVYSRALPDPPKGGA
ncbi:MAG: hypothetical protein AAGI03_15555 [Pseudomonadota bacterium]